jgi:SAM-dependent methyltransferase
MFQEINKIEQTYDLVAKEYSDAFLTEHERKPKDQEILRKFSNMIGAKVPVWDFGCGSGQTTKYLKDLGVEISGIDISERTIEQARTNHPNIYFRKGNILELDFENSSIAAIVAFYAIVHFSKEQVEVFFREVFRVLKTDGIFLFTYHIGNETIHVDEFLSKKVDIDFMFFNSDFIYSCLTKNGFEKVEIIEREPYEDIEFKSRRAYVFAAK